MLNTTLRIAHAKLDPTIGYAHDIVLSGPTSVIATHQTLPFTVVINDQRGNPMGPQVFQFASDNTAVAMITADGVVTGTTGVTGGTANITAFLTNSRGDRITSNAVTVTVSAQVATSPIAVTPSSASLADSGTLQASAVVSDQGTPPNVIVGASVTWTSGTPSKATVGSSTGLIAGAGAGAGSSTITATSGSATGTCALTVTSAAHTVTSVSVSPSTLATTVGAVRALVGTVLDENGNPMPGETGTWGSDTPAHETVDSSGNATGIAAGGATITFASVTNPAKTATCVVTVSAVDWSTPGMHPDAFFFDHGGLYAGADDAAKTANFQKVIGTSVGGAGGGTIKYNSGSNGSYASLTSVYLDAASTGAGLTTLTYEGNPVIAYHQPANTGITPQLWADLPHTISAMWFRVKYLYPQGWTAAGNGSGSKGFKKYGALWNGPVNRISIEDDGGGEIFIWDVNATATAGTTPCGAATDLIYSSRADPITAGTQAGVRDLIVCAYQVSSTLWRQMMWKAFDGTQPVLVGDMYGMMARGSFPSIKTIQIGLNKNNNTLPSQDFYYYQCNWQIVEYATNPDPWGLIALGGGNIDTMRISGAMTLTGISGIPTHGTSGTLTLTGTHFTDAGGGYYALRVNNLDPQHQNVLGTKTIVNSTTITVPFDATALAAGTYYLQVVPTGLSGTIKAAQTRSLAFVIP